MIRVFLITLTLVSFSIWLFFYQPSITAPILVSSSALFLILLLNGERISLIASRKVGLLDAAKGNALAVAGAYIVPGRVTELLKPAYFKMHCALPLSVGVSVVLAERVFDVLALLILVLFALMLIPSARVLDLGVSGDLLLFGCLALSLLIVLLAYRGDYLRAIISWLPASRLKKILADCITDFGGAFKEGLSIYQVCLSLLVWVGSGLSYWLFLKFDGGPSVAISDALLIFIVGTIGLTVTLTPGGLGTFEAAVAFTLTFFGYTADQSIVSALGLRLAGTLPTILVALFTLATEGVDLLTRLREQAVRGD